MILIAILVSSLAFATSDKELDHFFKTKTKINNPLELRDPFKSPVFKKVKEKKENDTDDLKIEDGVYSNKKTQDLNSLNVSSLRIDGVLIGKERRAIAKMPGTNTVIVLKEGMKIGSDGAELKAILPGGIILVEKIINVYGQEEFLETVIPISR